MGTRFMIYIAVIAIGALLGLELSGSIPDASVGGPLTIAVVIFATALAVGIRDAWLNKRGALGWIVSIIASFIGMFFAAQIAGVIFVAIQGLLGFGGTTLAASPLFHASLVGTVLISMLGSWLALRLVDRMR